MAEPTIKLDAEFFSEIIPMPDGTTRAVVELKRVERWLAAKDAYAGQLHKAAFEFACHCTAVLLPHEEQALDRLKAALAKNPADRFGVREVFEKATKDAAPQTAAFERLSADAPLTAEQQRHERVRRNMIAADAWPERTTETEKRLRKLLAGVYGLTYGDDGELQNIAGHPWIDFKRDPVENLERAIAMRAMAKMKVAPRVPLQKPPYCAMRLGVDNTLACEPCRFRSVPGREEACRRPECPGDGCQGCPGCAAPADSSSDVPRVEQKQGTVEDWSQPAADRFAEHFAGKDVPPEKGRS